MTQRAGKKFKQHMPDKKCASSEWHLNIAAVNCSWQKYDKDGNELSTHSYHKTKQVNRHEKYTSLVTATRAANNSIVMHNSMHFINAHNDFNIE